MTGIAVFRVVVAMTLASSLLTGARAQSNAAPAPQTETQKKSGKKKSPPLTADKLDPSFFEAINQRECDSPRACGCNCEDAPQAPQKNQ